MIVVRMVIIVSNKWNEGKYVSLSISLPLGFTGKLNAMREIYRVSFSALMKMLLKIGYARKMEELAKKENDTLELEKEIKA